MNKQLLLHIPKSEMAYAYDQDTLHIWLRTAKDDIKSIRLIFGDPFYHVKSETSDFHTWQPESTDKSFMRKRLSDNLYDYYFIHIKPAHLRVKYAFLLDERYLFGVREIYDLEVSSNKIHQLHNYFNFPFIHKADLLRIPSWVENTIWYEIFPDRFKRGINAKLKPTHSWGNPHEKVTNQMIFGGDLEGVIESLDYLSDLGINGIYFTPIFESPSTHKYDTTNYFKIDPAFGSNADFKRLVDEAHKKGIKVVLDAVFNHCGFEHPFFQDVILHGKDSIYYDAFHIKDETLLNFELNHLSRPIGQRNLIPNYHTFSFTPYMPKWHTEHPLVRKHLLEVASYWMTEYDIDGYRLDVSNEVSHDFWRDFRKVVKSIKPEAFIFGENWDNAMPWLAGDQFDGAMNYELTYMIWQFFFLDKNAERMTVTELKSLSNKLITSYPEHVSKCMFNLVDSHDTKRILSRANGNFDLAYLAYLFMFSFPGTPTLYYGGEIGLEGHDDPDNRRCMIWDETKQNLDFKARIKNLIKLRKTYDAFKSIDIIWYDQSDDSVLVYEKKGNPSLFFLMNVCSEPKEIHLNMDLLTLDNQKAPQIHILRPFSALILKK